MIAEMGYREFLDTKQDYGSDTGFPPVALPDFLFDFQRALVGWAIRKGRAGIFADCGMGKTPMQLVWADNVVRHTNRPVLVLTPLAVTAQTLDEADKFGIGAMRADVRQCPSIIQVTNYEKLHHFDAANYAGVVCDECFVAGTPVDTPTGPRSIETIAVGDSVLNAVGAATVLATKMKRLRRVVRVRLETGGSFVCSEHHPLFAFRMHDAIIPACILKPGDRLCGRDDAMRMVRQGVDSQAGKGRWSVLRDILLSEMEDAPTGDTGQGAFARGGGQAGQEEECMASLGYARGERGDGANPHVEPDRQSRSAGEDIRYPSRYGAPTEGAGRQRQGANTGPESSVGTAGRGLVPGIPGDSRAEATGLSYLLQGGYRQSECDGSGRSGWPEPPLPQGRGPETRCQAAGTRVDSVEILESGSAGFRALSGGSDTISLYDLQVSGHPSYSVHGILVHNSSILKNFEGQRKAEITEFMRRVPYRLLCTATAAPNDWIELGTSSEALGYLGHVDMLTRFFTDKGGKTKVALFRGRFADQAWCLKPHAEEPFWRWVASWARAARRPSDLGFADDAFRLPALVERHTLVKARTARQGMLFDVTAANFFEEREATRRTIHERCEAAAAKVAQHDVSMVWCHLNDEAAALKAMIPGAVEISGSDSDEAKEEAARWFCHGTETRRTLVSKSRIFGWGMNWQHCNHMTYFPTHSYEQYYQATRRLWRFGQTRPVTVDLIYTDGGEGMMQNLARKSAAADAMFDDLTRYMGRATTLKNTYQPITPEVPGWLKSK